MPSARNWEDSVTLPREEVLEGLQDELVRFGELVGSLSPDELAQPTRCAGWTVGDVAAHMIGDMADITSGRFDRLGNPELNQSVVDERKGMTAAELVEELQGVQKAGVDIMAVIDDDAWAGPAPGDLGIPLGEGVEALWYDAYVHGEDIRAALGRPSTTGPGLKASVSHVADLLTTAGWGPATLALDGMPEFTVSGGGGRRVTGDPLEFVLAATGRTDPAPLGLDETVNVYREQ
jgi:uncharacterized protein (TIGR03083 family)